MVRREIEIDEDTDRMITELEDFANRSEEVRENVLRTLRDASGADFREGRTSSWEDVKTRNGL
jgi:hypothetical protein